MNINFDKITLWSDSTITLHWINAPSHKLKTFVANRVAKIQELTKIHEWKHVPTHDNPADLVSRGQESWPNYELKPITIPELRPTVVLSTISNDFKKILT